MKYIYARAACVTIWLGLSDEFTGGALLLIDRADFGVATNFFAFKGYGKAVDGFAELLGTASAL